MTNRRMFIAGAAAAVTAPSLSWAQAGCAPVGRFNGDPSVDLLNDGRKLRLLKPLIYTARCGKVWTAPVGTISDGASIPGFLWWLVGTPLIGKYRNAAIVHDYYCARRIEPDLAVHQMFHEAMLASGVSAYEAAKLYFGVRLGGPTWDDLTIANERLGGTTIASAGTATGSTGATSSTNPPSRPPSPDQVLAAYEARNADVSAMTATPASRAAGVLANSIEKREELNQMMAWLPSNVGNVASLASLDSAFTPAQQFASRQPLFTSGMAATGATVTTDAAAAPADNPAGEPAPPPRP